MDLVLTGRPVPAEEAERIGLVNRVVPPGTSREEAERVAGALAALPQECLRNDRTSLLDQEGADGAEAMRRELALGMDSLRSGALEGAARFASGAGRHGEFSAS